jgi:MerR family Zn(II)-responsive transcriptional regulator of zntA
LGKVLEVTLTIGKVAGLTNVSPDTLRYYEREGLICPTAKNHVGYRIYDGHSVRRVRFIKKAQGCGFTLTEIRHLLALRSSDAARCCDVRRVAVEKKLKIEAKIKALSDMSKALDGLIAVCTNENRSLDDCPIFAALENEDQA